MAKKSFIIGVIGIAVAYFFRSTDAVAFILATSIMLFGFSFKWAIQGR